MYLHLRNHFTNKLTRVNRFKTTMSSVNASISVILIVVALINNAAPSQGPETSHGIPCKRVQCKENEEFACDSSGTKNPYYPCQKYCCQQYTNDKCGINTLVPQQGCYCKQGYERRASDSKCILSSCSDCRNERKTQKCSCPPMDVTVKSN